MFQRQLQLQILSFTGYSLEYQQKYWKAELKWNLNKEILNESFWLSDFRDSLHYIFSRDT